MERHAASPFAAASMASSVSAILADGALPRTRSVTGLQTSDVMLPVAGRHAPAMYKPKLLYMIIRFR